MTSITVTADPDNGALSLSIHTLQSVTSVTRTDSNGVAEVRTLPGVLPWTPNAVKGRKNKVPNPSSGTNGTATWTPSEVSLVATSNVITGKLQKYFRATLTAVTAGAFKQRADVSLIPVTVGVDYTLQFMARTTSSATGDVAGAIYFMDDTGAQVGTSFVTPLLRSSSFAQLKVTATAPAGAVTATLRIGTRDTTSWEIGEFFDFGAVMFGDDTTYFDGDTGLNSERYYVWTGTPYASETQEYVPDADLVLIDYEAASGVVSYVTGLGSKLTSWDIESPWIFVPVMPNYSARLTSVLDYSAGGDSLGTIHEMLGRTDPVAVLRGMGTRSGTLQLWAGTYDDAAAVVDACARGEVLMLRQPEHQGMDMYFTALNYNVRPLAVGGAATVWGIDLAYRELARPADPLAGALGWTFAALAAAYPNFRTLPQKYSNFQNMKLNEVKP